jgi:PAS domain S-box-containing protein
MNIRELIVGKEFIADRKTYKYAMLRGYFNFILLFIALFYIVLDSSNGVFFFIPWYLGMVVVAVVGLVINRRRYYPLANSLMIVFSNIIVFIFADADSPMDGLFFYFIATSLTALILFGYPQRWWGLAFVILSAVLGVIAFVYDYRLIPPPRLDPMSLKISFIASFIVGILTCAFIVYFLILENHHSEKVLEENQKQLIKTSQELQESKERFELAVKGTRAGIYEWSLKDNSIYISSSWKELLGYDEQELNSISINTFISFIHPEDRDRTSHLIDQVLKNLQPYQGETRMRTKSGEYKWFLDSGIVKADADGNASHVIGSLIDIDGRKKAEKEIIVKNNQLAKTNEELDRFVYSASHDMRAPLSSLLGLIHLSEKTSQLDELRLYNSMMKDRIQVMEGFIKEVTDYSRNTRLELSLSKISLANLVRDVVDHLSYSRINIKMKVVVEIESELTITTDPSRVKVILNNLISNAYKYHRDEVENPFIRITAYQSANQVLISIEDNGRGIGREHHHRIFDMFYRASENSEGSGLGLYIVKETLEKLGGDISVHSETGKGSTFTFALPILA